MDSNDITRRRVLGTLGAAGTIALAGCGGGDGGDGGNGSDGGDGGDGGTSTDTGSGGDGGDGSDGGSDGGDTASRPDAEVRIGMVQPQSGALGPYGDIALRGFYTYFGYAGADIPSETGTGETELTLGDTTYIVDVRDSQGAAGEAQSQATDLVQSGGADIIAGGTSSASAIAIANNVAKRSNVPYMAGPAASVSLTGDEANCGETVYRASETVAMDAQSGGRYIANARDDIKSVYIYYADYSFGKSVYNNYKRVLEANGVTVAGSQALPADYSDDWPGQFENATSAGVDAIIGGFTVAALPAMLGTYLANDYGFRFVGGFATKIAAGAFGQVLKQNLDELTAESIENAGLGPLTTRYHWNQYDNEMNTKANQIHRDTYGTNADLFTSGLFTAASAIDQAVTESGSANGDDIRAALKGMSVDTTMKGKGGYEFQEWNNQARSAMTVAPAIPTQNSEYWDAAIQPGDPVKTYPPEETTQPKDQQSCDLS